MRVGYEETGLELDQAGTARSIVRLRHELERRPGIELVRLAHPGRPRAGRRGRAARGLARELGYLPVALPREAARLELDLLHCPVGLAPVRSAVPLAVTLHDVMALDHPEWFTRGNVLQQRLVLGPALRRASAILTPSEHSRDRAVARLGLDPQRVHVTPWGVDERFSPGPRPTDLLERLGVRGRYLLTVGMLQPRKNLEAALAAFERLRGRHDVELVVAGSRGWRDETLVERLHSSPEGECVHLTGHVSDDELVGLYRGAECFLFPSRYEGFGFPPLEAMACGVPTVSSDRASLPEVVGDAGVLVDPDDPAAMAEAVEALLSSRALRDETVARGRERAGKFTWARCAEQTVDAYSLALARSRARTPAQ